MLKWIKQFFEKEDEHSAYNVLPCAAMQSEIIANELEEKEQNLSEPVNLIVESLKEEGRWTWEWKWEKPRAIRSHYSLTDSKTNLEVKVFPSYASLATCPWASYRENNHMGSEMLKMIATQTRLQEVKGKEEQREKITSLYKKAADAE